MFKCEYCFTDKPRTDSVNLPDGSLICAKCNREWLEQIKRDKYAEDMAEQRRESEETYRDREP